MELSLGTLNSFAHWEEPATLLAAVGGGGEALVWHWVELVQRSQTQATRWRVLLDETPILGRDGAQLIRSHIPTRSSPCPRKNLVYSAGMDRQLANTLLAARDRVLARHVAQHPLLRMPDFVNDLIAGRTEQEAAEHFERENRMAERVGRLSREGALFASLIAWRDLSKPCTLGYIFGKSKYWHRRLNENHLHSPEHFWCQRTQSPHNLARTDTFPPACWSSFRLQLLHLPGNQLFCNSLHAAMSSIKLQTLVLADAKVSPVFRPPNSLARRLVFS